MNPFTYNPEREPMPPIVAQRKHDVSEARYEVERIAPIYEATPDVQPMPVVARAGGIINPLFHSVEKIETTVTELEAQAQAMVDQVFEATQTGDNYDTQQAA